MAKTFKKQPAEVVDYFIDMTEYFEELEGDFIANASDIVTTFLPATDLSDGATVLVNAGADGFKQWFSGGLDGVTYAVTYVITTNVGRVEEIEMKLRVKEIV